MSLDSEVVRSHALALGFDLCGITTADAPASFAAYERWIAKGYHGTMDYLARSLVLRSDPRSLMPGAQSIIALGLNYNQVPEVQPGEPKIARYALGRDYHKVLRSKMKLLASSLQNLDPTAEFRPCVDSAPILERDLAQRAGLGWFGKNTCLINTHRGSWFFIALMLTNLRLEPDAPAVGGCGTCSACIDACPTGAIVYDDDHWQVDARTCISYLTIEHKGAIDARIGDWTFGCDICQEVCPFNQPREHQPLRATITTEPDFLNRRRFPNLEQLAQLSESDWNEATAGSPVRRIGIEGIRRNARINLTNQSG